ncbi:MAG: sigma-70 family RNA polymerase sigma factor [Polyangiaceae bacterium]|nr:sigma-70 family RNA polymerase sigma factor [Polyangiaceae bacterium]
MAYPLARFLLDSLAFQDDGEDPDAIEAAILRAMESARARWGDLALDGATFALHLGRCVRVPAKLVAELPRLATDDLYLVAACLSGVEAAWSILERRYLAPLERRIARSSAASGVDTYDRLRQDVLGVGRSSILASYDGRARLSTWLFGVARRKDRETQRSERRFVALPQSSDESDDARAPEDLELAHLRRHFTRELKDAIEQAIASLDGPERTLFRESLVEGKSIDALGEALGTHRATAARRLAKIRAEVKGHVYERLRAQLGLSGAELRELRGLVGEDLELSVGRIPS